VSCSQAQYLKYVREYPKKTENRYIRVRASISTLVSEGFSFHPRLGSLSLLWRDWLVGSETNKLGSIQGQVRREERKKDRQTDRQKKTHQKQFEIIFPTGKPPLQALIIDFWSFVFPLWLLGHSTLLSLVHDAPASNTRPITYSAALVVRSFHVAVSLQM